MKRALLVLGHKGMLGQMALKYFSLKGYTVHTLNLRYAPETRLAYLNQVKQFEDAVVINCIGRIKQKTNDTQELLWANAILPMDLAKELMPMQTLIHPSTDCVFAGTKGQPYGVADEQDANDDYGWSKQLGEQAAKYRNNTHIVRVSIIGTDHSGKAHGLLGWFLSQPADATLKGYANHLWNGITTLEWCKYVETLLTSKPSSPAQIHQLGTSEHYSKYEMLCMFNQIFETGYNIQSFMPDMGIDRRLEPVAVCQNLRVQLEELKIFDNHDNLLV